MARDKLFVKEIMTSGVISVLTTDNVQKAIDLMSDRNISCVVVHPNKEDHKPVGIITERDLVRRVLHVGKDPKKMTCKDVMTSSVVSVSEDASLEEAMRIVQNMRIRRLPVVGAEGAVGLITQTDIVKQTYDIHQYNKQLVFHQNVQSYVIIGLAIIFVVAFIIRFWFG